MKHKTKTMNLILSTLLVVSPALGADKNKAPGKLVVPGKGVIRLKAAAQGTFLGVALAEIPALARAQLGLAEGVGVAVGHVAKGSPAEKAGLKVNDVITQLDDQLIVNAPQFQTLIRTKKPGDQVTLTYIRKGKTQNAKVKLAKGAMPPVAGAQPKALRLRNGQWQPLPGGQWQQFRFPGGLGMMQQFNLDPKNQEQFKKQMEALQKQLQKMQGMDPDDLRDLFQQGGAIPLPGNAQPFRFDFNVIPPGQKPNNPKPGNRQFNFNANINSSVTMSDNTGSYTLNINNGKKHFKVKAADGEELFNGPVDTKKQRDALDRDLFKKLEQLEGKGKGGIRLRQFNFDGRNLNPGGGRNFRLEFPPKKNKPEKKSPNKRSDA
jgi:hypothetical protein